MYELPKDVVFGQRIGEFVIPTDYTFPNIISARSLNPEFSRLTGRKSLIFIPSEKRCTCFDCTANRDDGAPSTTTTTEDRSLSPESGIASPSRHSIASSEYQSSVTSSPYIENHYCLYCPAKFINKDEQETHTLTHKSDRTYKCQICDRAFTWFGNFQKHMLNHGDKASQLHPYFISSNISEEELFIREGSNTFRCGLCFKTFSRMSGLRTHVRMHSGQRPFKCLQCSLAFTTNRALKMHLRIHSGERPFKCSECSKCFTRKDELQAHIYLHKGEKPFKCSICPSAFVRHGHLQRHMLTHAVEKPYKCKTCTKSFTQYRNLQTHMYKHTGERPYKCRYCGKGFTQYGTVQAHERTHTGKKPYPCNQCDKRFITSSHLRWHVKRHHANCDIKIIKEEDHFVDVTN